MKKIINNLLYDTDTARRVGCWDNNLPSSDFGYVEETLYRKRTGEHFLHAYGGAASRYARRVDAQNWASGEAILPLTYEAAAQWAEEHLSADEYMAAFGPVSEEKDNSVHLHICLPASLAARVRQQASQSSLSLSEYIARRLAQDEES